MFGCPSIGNEVERVNRISAGEQWRRLLACAAVGVLAGVAASHARLHLGLSGHRALLWMVPVIVARLTLRSPIGATAGGLAAACTALGVGGHLAGGPAHLALIGLAGALLDAAIGFAERRSLAACWMIPLLGCAGALANLVCFGKRLVSPTLLKPHLLTVGSGTWGTLASYAFFGLFAGLLGAALGHYLRRRAEGPRVE